MISPTKVKEWIDVYLEHIKEVSPETHVQDEEGYKFKAVDNFQQNFNIEASDLAGMIDTAVVNNNLVSGSWYFPRKMLLIFAKENENETRDALRYLFDETKPAKARINYVENVFEKMMEARNERLGETSHSFIGIRFLSLLLGYRFPNTENALKPREWRVFCKYVDNEFSLPNGTSSGDQYETFRPYVEEIRKYITTIPEIVDLRERLTHGLSFKDEQFRWMAQDVIYVTSKTIAKQLGTEDTQVTPKEEEDPDEEGKTPATIDDKFYYEADLENFIIDNLDKLGIGDDARLYTDEKGVQGQQYPVDGGYIDLLLKDRHGNFIVVELKRDRSNAAVVGQILGYINWVEENLSQGRTVRGVIICGRGNTNLSSAVRAVKDRVELKYYSLRLELNKLD